MVDYYSHSEDTRLQVSDTIAELKEGQRDEQRDESVNEETAEDILRRSPKGTVITLDNFLQLVPERCGV